MGRGSVRLSRRTGQAALQRSIGLKRGSMNSLNKRSIEGGSGHQGTRGSLEGIRRLISAQK